jgi:hypothetical protein
MRTRSSMKLLLVALGVVALVLAITPVSFAGEDDPGPTQVGEVQGPSSSQSPAASQGPETSAPSHDTLGVTTKLASSTQHTSKKDTVRAVGGIQTGVGGMAATAWNPTLALALAGGGVVVLLAAGMGTPLRRRMEG